MRMTINKEIVDISTGMKVEEKGWCNKKDCAKGSGYDANRINKALGELKVKVFKIFDELNYKGVFITGELLKQYLKGNVSIDKKLIGTFKEFINVEEVKFARGASNKGKDTLRHYKSSLRKLEDFLASSNKASISLNNLTENFLVEYGNYMAYTEGLSHNTVQNHLKKLKTVLSSAFKNGVMKQNIFASHVFTYKEPETAYLEDAELKILEEMEFGKEYLGMARDFFLFCCRTGLSFCDLETVHQAYIKKMPNCDWEWVVGCRGKTGEQFTVPLFSDAKMIIEKYKNHPVSLSRGTFFPIPSLKNYNKYLKIVAEECGISKNISSHVARHTFATKLFSLGISREAIGKMLGHKSVKTTQVYAKVVPLKIINEMQTLFELEGGLLKNVS